jgi:hypothetical protein
VSRLPCPLESEEGKAFVAFLRLQGLKFTHIPNETGGSDEAKRRAIRMKQQGTSKGFLDYIIVIPYVGLAIVELKRQYGSTTSPEQLEWVAALNTVPGVQAEVCKGAAAAIAFVSRLMGKSLAIEPVDKSIF